MDEYGMNEFEMIKKADVMRIINAENAAVLNNRKERSTDEVLCAIASQINGLQATAKSGRRLIDADAFSEQYGNYYAEEGPAEGFIGTVGELIAKQPTIEPEVRHGRWVYDETIGGMKHYYCTSCKERDPGNECFADENQILWFAFCPKCGARMDATDTNVGGKGGAENG